MEGVQGASNGAKWTAWLKMPTNKYQVNKTHVHVSLFAMCAALALMDFGMHWPAFLASIVGLLLDAAEAEIWVQRVVMVVATFPSVSERERYSAMAYFTVWLFVSRLSDAREPRR